MRENATVAGEGRNARSGQAGVLAIPLLLAACALIVALPARAGLPEAGKRVIAACGAPRRCLPA